MYSIKDSFSNCSACDLFDAPSCILDTNCKKDLSQVDVVFIAENPGKDEIKKEIPLVGKAGQMFRKYFKKYDIDKMKYLLTNTVLCQTLLPDGKTGNPTSEVINLCKENCMNIIKICNPKLVVLMGGSPMEAFGFGKGGITVKHQSFLEGSLEEWEGYPVAIMVHPSFVNRQSETWEPKYEAAMARVSSMLSGKATEFQVKSETKSIGKGIFRYKIPEKFYTDEYRLIDVQYLNKTSQVLYIFRDKDNNKVYHKESDNYICYQVPKDVPAKKMVPYDDLNQIQIKYRDRYNLDPQITYEGDVRITSKHAMDYYHYNQGEPTKTFNNVMYADIEIDTGDEKIFPKPIDALFPINMLTTIYNGVKTLYVIDNKTEPIQEIDGVNFKIFANEKSLLQTFIKDFKQTDPDFIAGWNCVYKNEFLYLEDRIIRIKDVLKNDKLSLYGNVNDIRESGEKTAYKIKLYNGAEIITSDNHIFPYYKLNKNNYYTNDKLIIQNDEKKLKDIMQELKDFSIYLNIDKHSNNNREYTWRDYIYDSIEKILLFDEFDVCINSNIIKERIRKNAPHMIPVKDYWWGKKYYRNKYWSFKSLKDYVSIKELKEIILKSDEITFRINTSFVDINLTKEIDKFDLQLLGFEYTDGFWSKYCNSHCFDNKNKSSVEYYKKIMKKYSKKQRPIEKDWNKRDYLYTFGFGYINQYSLLVPLIYETNRQKSLDITLLSRMSFNQFISFISGFIDGDGSVGKKEIRLCNFEKGGEGPKKLYNLLLKNGIFSFLSKDGVVISFEESNKNFIELLSIQNSDRKLTYEQREYFSRKNSCSNIIGLREFEHNYVVRIESIEKLDERMNMIDIETESSYFSCNSIKTHNCINFDLFYIFTRLPLIGIPQGSISKFGEFYVDGSKYVCNLPGCVAIDQDYVYRTFTFTKMENYKLGFIAQEELGITKIQLPLSFNEMYWKMLNKTIEYNIRDTELLEKLDTKLAHINLLNELRIICNTSFDSVSSFGQIDSLMVSYLRNKGIASKNSDPHIAKEDYPGAFVFQPTPGVYDYITDFDFASLYPSLMITYNIGVNSFIMKTEDPTDGYDITYHPENLPDKVNMIIDPLYEKKVVQLDKKELFKFIQEKNLVHTINGCFFKPHEKEFSSFGQVVDMLMTSRKDYKEKMFKEKDESAEYKYFYTRQLVYKVLANTLYGVVANKSFRFFDTSLASAVTLSGQEALKTSIIYGDAFMRSIAKGTEIEEPKPLTKLEMFSSDMPDRSNEYIVTGDTDSIFCCFEKVPLNNPIIDINNWCLQIEKYLNEDKILEVVKKHNVNLQFNRLKLKNELLISRGLFLAKKRYVIRVIMNEGKEVDKINFMGIEIKRSDYPSKSKEFMRELSDLILRSERVSLTKLLKYVQEQEKGFVDAIESGSKTVARPVSWGKEIKNYKLVPQGVKAMQAWNDIMYPIHKTGVKAYMFWVRGIDIEKAPEDVIKKYHAYVKAGNGKLEVIAIPDDEEKLPNYFIPNRDAALKFVFRDRYELMLKPLTDAQLMKQKATILTF